MSPDIPDTTPLVSDFLDPRGDGWRNIDPLISALHASRIRAALDNRLGYEPHAGAELCREIAGEINTDPDLAVAVFRWLNSKDRAQFKAWCRS